MTAVGHKDVFLRPRLSARYRFGRGPSPGRTATGETRR
jgi:hypothetical protein